MISKTLIFLAGVVCGAVGMVIIACMFVAAEHDSKDEY